MTAVVGILNKFGVAIAADSAVTYGSKITNKANKVFSLSKYHPVGMMIYNLGAFMGTPWEVIIKEYRRQLSDRHFSRVEEYRDDFVKFLKEKSFFSTEEVQEKHVDDLAFQILTDVANFANEGFDKGTITQETVSELINERIENSWIQTLSTQPKSVEFSNFTFEDFLKIYDHKALIRDNLHFFKGLSINVEDIEGAFSRAAFELVTFEDRINPFTGLIFTGFGEDEIFPQLVAINVSFAFAGRLRYLNDDGMAGSISHSNGSVICPFGQTDVINTILTGVDPLLERGFQENFINLFQKYNGEILSRIGESNPLLKSQVESIDYELLASEFNNLNAEVKQDNYIIPLMNAVSSLSKEDLAEMAESLIYLTFLKRRITLAEESVGGPVDVALITKAEGLVWIKRKHYFRPELNQNFFQRYFT